MAKSKKSISMILHQAQDTLFTAKLGLDNINSDEPKVRIVGIWNLIVFGRAVTNVLQNLRGLTPEFEQWYKPYKEKMQADPLMKFFYKQRSEILKEGKLDVHSSVRLSGNPMLLLQKYPKPPHAKSFFIGDQIGGTGWEVEMSDGTIEKYYIELPNQIQGLNIDVAIHFADLPEELRDIPAPKLCKQYYDYLEQMVADANRKFEKVN